MSAYQLKDFSDIINACLEELKIQSTDTVNANRLRRLINEVYIDDVCAFKRFWWLSGHVDVAMAPYYANGTCSVTPASTTVSLSVAPAASDGSKTGYYFSVEGIDEIYTIASHTAESQTITLSTTYNGALNATATYRIWTDKIVLPTDCRETVEVWHDFYKKTMDARGLQDFRKLVAEDPKQNARPAFYSTYDFVDPTPSYQASTSASSASFAESAVNTTTDIITITSHGYTTGMRARFSTTGTLPAGLSVGTDYYLIAASSSTLKVATSAANALAGTAIDLTDDGTGTHRVNPLTLEISESEDDRYRILKVYPAMYTATTTIHIDYIKEVPALELAGDEPLMPIEDRSVLKYGALSLAWATIQRNPEEAQRNRALFEGKLARMAGKIEDTFDTPSIVPNSSYLSRKRGPRLKAGRRGLPESGSGGGASTPNYAANITLNGGTFTGNFTATAGVTIDGRDIGVDGTTLDSHIAATSSVHGATGSVVGTTDSQTLTNKTIVATSNTITEILNANIGATAAIDRSKIATGTAYRILANNSAGVMSQNAALTSGYLTKVDANGQLADATNTDAQLAALVAGTPSVTSATLTDNTASATLVTSWAYATYDSVTINYSLKRGTSNKASGVLKICTDGTNASIAQSEASIGTLGVTFTVDISGANLRLLFTTTSTGTAATFKYKEEKWLA